MCGLFASVGLPPDPGRIDIVSHRGPDGRGWGVFGSPAGPVALGHRRLAIIDVSEAGHQPMASLDGHCQLIFNGEIYNFLELREELESRGEVFSTNSDSEVLLRAWLVWGRHCLKKLRGMFAFLIWDAQSKRLFAARDRYGIKPLYLTETTLSGGNSVAFASEIKQLLGLPGVSGRMNMHRARDFLRSGIMDHTAETLFEGIIQLRGGEFAEVDTASGKPQTRIERWYPINVDDVEMSEMQAVERFRDLLSDSVRLHLRSDVPVGSCLSGGLDSSSIVGLMAKFLSASQKVNTVSACYEEKAVDEKPFMDAVVAKAGTQPHFIYPRADDVFSHASQITWHQDEPFGSTSIFAQWCVFEEARKTGIKVMLDGQGADEQLGGYHNAFAYHLANLTRQGRFISVASTILERQRVHNASISGQVARYAEPILPHWLSSPLQRARRTLKDENWLKTDPQQTTLTATSAMDAASASLGLGTPRDLRSLCIVMTFASNLQMLLHWEDRNSMAHSIEARVPFLDHPLVEFSLSLGNNHKIVGTDTKHVLRRAAAEVLPDIVRDRRDKLGFQTPESVWFRGPLRGMIHDGVETTLSRYPDIFDGNRVRKMRDMMLDGSKPVDNSLWRIVNFGIWGERFAVGV